MLFMAAFLFLSQHASMGAEVGPQQPLTIDHRASNQGGMRAGLQDIELILGYGKAHAIFGTQDDRRQYVILNPRWGIFLTDVVGKIPYKGALELLFEPIAMFQFEPEKRYAVGLSALFRYNFWTGSKVTPFFDAGAGILQTDFGLPEQGSNFNFQPQVGVGLHLLLQSGTALTFQYRFHHISNASIADPNLGINSSLFLIGISFFR